MMFPANIWIKSSRAGTIRILLQSRSATPSTTSQPSCDGTFFSTSDTGFIASTTAAAAPPAFGPIALLHAIRLARGVARDDRGHCGARLG